MAVPPLPGDGPAPIPIVPVEETGTPVPVPPHYLALLMAAEQDIASARAGVDAVIEELLGAAERDIRDATAEVNIAISTQLGTIAQEVGNATIAVYRVIERKLNDIIRDITTAQYELRNAGIPVPYDWRAIYLINEDTTGQLLLNLLDGIEFPKGVIDGSSAPTTVSGSQSETGAVLPIPGDPFIPPVRLESGFTLANGDGGSVGAVGLPPPPAPAETGGGGGGSGGGGQLPPQVTSSPGSPPSAVAPTVPPVVPVSQLASVFTPVAAAIPPMIQGVDIPSPQSLALQAIQAGLPLATALAPSVGDALSPSPTPAPKPKLTPWMDARDWSTPAVCADHAGAFAQFSLGPFYASDDYPAETPIGVSDLWGLIKIGTSLTIAGVFGADAAGREKAAAQQAVWNGDTLSAFTALDVVLHWIPDGLIHDRRQTTNLGLVIAATEKVARDTGVPLQQVTLPLLYLWQYEYPRAIPDQTEIDALWATGQIDQPQWTCYTKMHGNDPDLRVDYARLGFHAMGARETTELWLRGAIDDAQRDAMMRRQGIEGSTKLSQWYTTLAQWRPSAPDLIRWMVRDVFDDQAVKAEGLDEFFEQKLYGGPAPDENAPIAKYLRAAGIRVEEMRREWRAHWQAPSNTIAFDALHRLREDRPEVVAYRKALEEYFKSDKVGEPPVEPLIATPADVRQLLAINDMFPRWIDRAMAMSYLPMNRTDAIAAFMANLMDESELHHRFRDVGYDEPTAARMVLIQKNLRARRISNVSGVWTIRKIAKEYRAGTITRFSADQLLQPLLVDPDQRRATLNAIDLEASAETRKRQLAAIRRGYFVAEYGPEEAEKRLANLGTDPARRKDLIEQWTADRDGRFREPSARQIIQWQTVGIISAQEALVRLRRLGYSAEDAERMAYQGLIAASERIESRVDKAQGKIDKMVKDMKSAARERTADLEKRQKQIEKQQKEWQKEMDKINKELESRKK